MRLPFMLQGWEEITFLHWSCDPKRVQHRLPSGLLVDTFNGKGWISLTPFVLRGLRTPLIPSALGMDFPEMNLRTYVRGPKGPGIWFFSLDAGKLLPVIGARAIFGLPYYWAEMSADVKNDENCYRSRRRNRGPFADIRIAKGDAIPQPSLLDNFLTARFRLYSAWASRLITAQVVHPPWDLRKARILELKENVRQMMGLEFPAEDFVVHHSTGVDTKIELPSFAL